MATKPEIMTAYLDRVVSGDLEGAAESYTDDVVFHWAGRSPLSGDHEGKAAVLDLFADYANRVRASIETHDLLYSEDHAVVLNRATLTRGDRSITTNRVVVYHFVGDKISEVWVLDEDQQSVDELLA